MKQNSPYPVRKQLPHRVPDWVPDHSRYFITINCRQRGRNVLCRGTRAQSLLGSIAVYEDLEKWWMHLFVVMPDHVHLIASFNKAHAIQVVLRAWKSFQARTLGIEWQADYFEHRLRDDVEFAEKAAYVRLNPVRQGLVTDWRDWPHLFQRGAWTDS